MVNLKLNKLRMITAASVVVIALASTPASAHHGHSIVGPAVAFIALGALLQHNHYGHNHYGRNHYGNKYGYNQHRYKRQRQRSYSHGGYHNKRRKNYSH